MPRMSTIAGTSIRAFGFAWGALTSIFDNWVSGTPRSLGTSTSGTAWTVVTGTWNASGNGLATTSTAATSFPMATVPLNQNVQGSIQNASPGSGLVFWETDAGDWWASIINVTTATAQSGTQCVSSTCCTGSNTCVPSSCCTTYSTCVYNGCCGGTYSGEHGACVGGSPNDCCTGSPTGGCNASTCCTGSNTCVSNSCCSYAPTYATFYYWGLAIIKSVASTISTVASKTIVSTTAIGTFIQSLSITIIGSTIGAQAYSDQSLNTPQGTPLTTTGTPGGTKVGIIVAPTTQGAATSGSAYGQGNSVGQFSVH